MQDTMRVFKSKKRQNEFVIQDCDIMWTDFARRGNPMKGVPANTSTATFCVKFDSPTAGADVAQVLEDDYEVKMKINVPDPEKGQDFKPFKSTKIMVRFDHFPPKIILHTGDNVTLLSDVAQRDPNGNVITPSPREVEERFDAIKGLDDYVIERIDATVNVYKFKDYRRNYASRLEIWLATDMNGQPIQRSAAVSEDDELILEGIHDDIVGGDDEMPFDN